MAPLRPITDTWSRDDAAAFVADVKSRGGKYPPIAGGAPTIEELEARLDEIEARFKELDAEYAGKRMAQEARSEWNKLVDERKEVTELVDELRGRLEYIREVAGEPESAGRTEDGVTFHTPRSRGQGDNIWDVAAVRMAASGPEDEARMLRDNAMRAVEQSTFPHDRAEESQVRAHIERLMERFAGDDSGYGGGAQQEFARRILTTGSPAYKRAFGKMIAGRPLSAEEQRALSLTGASGGFAVPYTLDPTIIPTSNSTVNPMRAISRVETIAGSNEWRGVSSGAITASRDAEGAEVSDDTPTLAQPTAKVTKVAAFVPFSIEVGQDWGSLQSEMATLLQDAKDDEEAAAFVTGTGDGSTGPQGVVVGATGTVAAGTAAFAVAHLYALEEALAPRFRPRGQFVGNRAQYNRIRQFDTSGGAALWIQNLQQGLNNGVPTPGDTGATLLGYPAKEASAMASVLTAASALLIFGDFRYYLIVDRIGMDVELVPHLFGASGRPTGQRGLYAYWRNSGLVLAAAAFKKLVTT